jgi:hypothetical protein
MGRSEEPNKELPTWKPNWLVAADLPAENMTGFFLSLVMQQSLNDVSHHDLGKN